MDSAALTNVRGGKQNSASAGKAESHCRLTPPWMALLVRILKSSEPRLIPYLAATARLLVVLMGANCSGRAELVLQSKWDWEGLIG